MLLVFITCIAALAGLAFGSFLNVCATRLPEGESIVTPASHCRSCARVLNWYENIPVASWCVLRGRCRSCGATIGWRYPLIEAATGVTWAVIAWQTFSPLNSSPALTISISVDVLIEAAGKMILCWLLILLAALDAEYLWLPNRITLGGAALGIPFALVRLGLRWAWPPEPLQNLVSPAISNELFAWLLGIAIGPSFILLVRWSYRLIRKREGIGLGDAKLMLLLAVWLGLANMLLAFVLGVFLGTLFSLFILVVPRARRDEGAWHLNRIPLGSFLCVGGILSAIWGAPIIEAYLHLIGL